MGIPVKSVVAQALALPVLARLRLVDQLLDSIDLEQNANTSPASDGEEDTETLTPDT